MKQKVRLDTYAIIYIPDSTKSEDTVNLIP